MTHIRWAAFPERIGFVLLLVILCGCGREGPALARVSGVVTYQGKPLAAADVLFAPLQGGRPATATTDDQGRFELTTFTENDGALLGEHAVIITKVATSPAGPATKSSPSGPAANVAPQDVLSDPSASLVRRTWLIPARYSDAKTSRLSATVAPGGNTVQFNLTP